MNPPLSVFIICQDEERIIGACLEQVAKIADEIIVVDSGSTDATLEIARRFTDRIYHQDWLGYGRQKNVALSKCENEWVMSVDSDEVIPDDLIDEIRELDFQAPAYRIARKLFLGNKFIRWGGYYPDYQLRLFRKSLGRFSDARVHESVKLNCRENCPRLSHPLNHYSYENLAEMRAAFREFAELSDRQANLPRAVLNFLYTLFNKLVLRLGFLHGMLGLKLALNHAEYSFRKYRQFQTTKFTTLHKPIAAASQAPQHAAGLVDHPMQNR